MINNIVIIDDTDYKRRTIVGYMTKIFPKADIYECSYINEALRFLCRDKRNDILGNPDKWLIITDMVMPRMLDTRLIADGGMDVLSELERNSFECPVIVASSMEIDLDECRSHYENVVGVVEESISVYNAEKYRKLLVNYTD